MLVDAAPRQDLLIIEDDDLILASIKEFLEDEGFRVRTASNGLLGLEVLRNGFRPALILLDLMMPVMDGFHFRENQLQDATIKEIPVVIMSADGHVAEKKIRTSVNDYLKKPLDIFALLETVHKFTKRPNDP